MSSNVSPLKPDNILRSKAVLDRIKPSPTRNTLKQWIARGLFPEPFMLNGRPAWLESQVDQFIESRVVTGRAVAPQLESA